MPATRSTLVLAYGIAEWQSAIDHLDAMKKVGVDVPLGSRVRIEIERDLLVSRFYEYWQNAAPFASTPEPVMWARRYLLDHPTELETLLAEEQHATTEAGGEVRNATADTNSP